MYYYIFDPSQGAKEYERSAQIKELLSNLGIAGEMTSPAPGKSVEDLVELAVAKRYSTIVAVGGMELINRVARALEPHDVVFGIIPTQAHPDISRLIGVDDWKSAAEQLKLRRWKNIRLGIINDTICFLTPARFNLAPDQEYTLITPQFTTSGVGGSVSITPVRSETDETSCLVVNVEFEKGKKGFMSTLFHKGGNVDLSSRFTVETLSLETEPSVVVEIAGTPLSQTPVQCTTQEKVLKLIVAKGTPDLGA